MKKTSIALFIASALFATAAFAYSVSPYAANYEYKAADNSEVEASDAVPGTCSGKYKMAVVLTRHTDAKGTTLAAEFQMANTNLLNVSKKMKMNLLAGDKKMINIPLTVSLVSAECAKPSMSNCVKHYYGAPELTQEQVEDVFKSDSLKIDFDFNGCEFVMTPFKDCYQAFKNAKTPTKKAVCKLGPLPEIKLPPKSWTDAATGLTWSMEPSKDASLAEAHSYCENLPTDGGGWRLPTVDELRSLVKGCDGTAAAGKCKTGEKCLKASCADKTCKGCEAKKGAANGCYLPAELGAPCEAAVWSGSAVKDDKKNPAWSVNFADASVAVKDAASMGKAMCVKKEKK